MPGITGIVGPGVPDKNKADLNQMVRCMIHEPFYTWGTYIDEHLGICLGWISHRDSFADCMPVWNEGKDICLIFSGEDFTDLNEIQRLRNKGHVFMAESAEYLVHLYEEDGREFFRKLNGRFCGVIADFRNHQVILFNDRYGLNRIYFFEHNGCFYFSSEAKSLLAVFPEMRRLDVDSLGQTFAYGCVLQNRTLFTGISLVPGGSVWTLAPGQRAKKEHYFRPESWESKNSLTGKEYYDQLRETWNRILPRYMRGTERVALSLTGGIDSRMILAWARSPHETLPCYTFRGPFRESMDVRLAKRIAAVSHHPYQTILIDQTFMSAFPQLAERVVYLTDGLMDVSGAPELYVNSMARQIAPVKLTGNYGQEILRHSIAFRPRPFYRGILKDDFVEIMNKATGLYYNELGQNPLSFTAFRQVPWHHYSRFAVELSQLTPRSPYLDNDLVALSYQAPGAARTNIEMQLRLIGEGNPALKDIGTDRGILYQSRPLMTKARYLYQQFTAKAEYAYDYGMPQSLVKLDYALKRFRPERIFLGRHKFSHFRIWYRDEFSSYVKEILLDGRTKKRSYLNGQRLEGMVMAHIKGIGNYTSEIHRILTAELFQRQFLD
jgi:asparagine synthase (glutamine-hydrolysing)